MTSAVKVWDSLLGRRVSLCLENVILRGIRWNQEIYASWLQSYVGESTRWLDAGCGRRILPPDFEALERRLVRRARLATGVDQSASSLSRHTALLLRSCASLEQLPFPDASFDLVTCNMVVEHLPHPNATFREFERVLCVGGVLLLHTPNTWNYAVALARILKALVPAGTLLQLIRWAEDRQEADIFPTHYRANSRKSLTAALQCSGFICERFEQLVGPQPVCRIFAPLAFCELLVMRATMWKPLRPFATTMLCSFRKVNTKGTHATELPHQPQYSALATPA